LEKETQIVKLKSSVLWFVGASLLLASCNLPSKESQELSTPTVLETEMAPTDPQLPATEAEATLAPACNDAAVYITWTRNGAAFNAQEVEKLLAPNSKFTISWELKNTGDCIWNSGYKMHFLSGMRLTEMDTFALVPGGYHIQPGEVLTVNIEMTAPNASGDYESTFAFVNDKGANLATFGVPTRVGSSNTNTNGLSAPGDLKYTYDCSSGSMQIRLLWEDRSGNEEGFRIYREGSKVGEVSQNSTSFLDIAPSPGKWQYRVAAFNSNGESSTNVTAQTPNCN